jgi:Lrp/AsnC family transcriptional regulator for asnA, asnC and gidA
MSYKVDSVDQALVDLLIEDGRMSCTEMARRLGDISERAVRYRLDRMVQEGVIRISAVVNPKSLGLSVIADVFIEVEPGRIMDVANELTGYECVNYVACSTGDRDVSIQVVAHDNTELYNFVTKVIGKVPGVRKTTTVLVPLILRNDYEWRIPTAACVDTEGEAA